MYLHTDKQTQEAYHSWHVHRISTSDGKSFTVVSMMYIIVHYATAVQSCALNSDKRTKLYQRETGWLQIQINVIYNSQWGLIDLINWIVDQYNTILMLCCLTNLCKFCLCNISSRVISVDFTSMSDSEWKSQSIKYVTVKECVWINHDKEAVSEWWHIISVFVV